MSIITFILYSIIAVVAVPPILVFVFCILLGASQTFWEGFKTFLNNKKQAEKCTAPTLAKEEARVKAATIILNKVEKTDDSTFH